MKYWPSSPLIIIKEGTYYGTDISGSTASMRDIDNPRGGYYLLDGPKAGYVITLNNKQESIDEWETAVATPVMDIIRLRDTFRGFQMPIRNLEAVMRMIARLWNIKELPPAFHAGGSHQKNYEQNENV